MKSVKKKINGYDTWVYSTTKYSTIHIKFTFEMPYTRENIFKYDLLEEYLIHSCAKYKTRKELLERKMELYSLSYKLENWNLGEKMFVDASFAFYDPELIGDDYMREALEFVKDILFYPNFEGGQIDAEELERSKANLVSYVDERLMNFRSRASEKFIETMFPNSYMTVDQVNSKKEYEDIMNSYTESDLIEAHRYLLDECLVGLVVFGNIKDEYLKYIEELFEFKHPKKLDREYNEVISINKDIKDFYHEEDGDYSEAVVRAVYKYEADTLKEKMAYNVITRMLGSSGMIIHKTLREEMGIVYMAGASYSKRNNYFVMTAFIDAKNLDRAVEGFDLVLEKLDEKTIESLLDKIKEEIDLSEYVFDEIKGNVFAELYDNAYEFIETMEERNETIRSLSVEDIKIAISKMKKISVMFYEGVKK